MGRKIIDLTGQKFNRLTVLERADDYITPQGVHYVKWKCQCECGNIVEVTRSKLVNGDVKSCGCLNKETRAIRNKRYNYFEIHGDCVTMYTQKDEPFYIDLEDLDKVKNICWYKNKHGYIAGLYNNKIVLIHRFILDTPDDLLVDHRNHNTSDNRKSNLRIATRTQNNINVKLRTDSSSGVTGVNWNKESSQWVVRIGVNKKRIYLGQFDTLEEAIAIRKEAEEKYFGEWSYDNSQRV